MNKRSVLLLLSLSLLAGCTVGPDYRRPSIEIPVAFKEGQDWKPAQPAELVPRGKWWQIYGDPQLDALVEQVEINNQNVAAAAAQYRQALALLDQARAPLFPTVAGSLAGSRGQGTSGTSSGSSAVVSPGSPVRNSVRASFNASWEADIWGGVRRNVESNQAGAQASAADLQAALLSAQATLVQSYLQLKANDAQRVLLDETAATYQRSLEVTQNRYAAGVAGRSDVAQALTQLKSTQAQAIDLGVQRAQLEHAIALLVGKPPENLTIARNATLPPAPVVPAGLPSRLLERRPDVAGAERRAAAANAQIGVAQAAFFPALTLSAVGGYQGSSFSHLLSLPNRFWSLGPALAQTIFDGGLRAAQKQQAMAAYDRTVALYRQTVLTAFQEVEDNLAALAILAQETELQGEAAAAAAEFLTLTNNQYKAGTVSYLNVAIAQAASLSAERSRITIASSQLQASVGLLKALGGDWQ